MPTLSLQHKAPCCANAAAIAPSPTGRASTKKRSRNAHTEDVSTAEELAITRYDEIVSVTLFASERTLATLRQFPPHGCDVRTLSRVEAIQIIARSQTLDGVVLLTSILGPHAQG